ncbi:lasso peptide biosynthesis PqqD family chaperone [Metabacillus fastidiosus]|uniref:lasso peptide biosynthesis PqqD family chaperone n=1 Tax=Metabacillus fastidiosus TaxID=1458 RepID=UPI002DBABE9A|nr:lasso peptide biosynthesis PqqD family chaperone [Metabacillus fastidiosus]MEC2076074.1 lasso peptide biosynthesis PqqD family chaperone [Metabacillus fastidiosus]
MEQILELPLNTQIVRSEGFVASDMDGEKVMMSIANGKYYNLGETGGVIWDFLQSPVSINQIVTKLMSEYDVEERVCREEVLSFLVLLYKEGLVKTNQKEDR